MSRVRQVTGVTECPAPAMAIIHCVEANNVTRRRCLLRARIINFTFVCQFVCFFLFVSYLTLAKHELFLEFGAEAVAETRLRKIAFESSKRLKHFPVPLNHLSHSSFLLLYYIVRINIFFHKRKNVLKK